MLLFTSPTSPSAVDATYGHAFNSRDAILGHGFSSDLVQCMYDLCDIVFPEVITG